jgi:hypothetical protein
MTLWALLVLIVVLIVRALYGALVGAERSQVLFNSIPLGAYWEGLWASRGRGDHDLSEATPCPGLHSYAT